MNIERVKYEKFIYCQQNLKPTQFEICSKTVGVCVLFSWCAVILHTMWKMPIFFWLKIEFIPYADAKCKDLHYAAAAAAT